MSDDERTECDLEIERIEALIDIGRWEMADRRARTLLASNPHESRALLEIARCEVHRDPGGYGEAEQLLRQALAQDPTLAAAQELLVAVLVDLERLDEADALACDLLAREPGWVPAHVVYADVCLAQKRFELASSAVARALEIRPDDPRAWRTAVKIARISEAPITERRRLVERWMELDPQDAEAHVELGFVAGSAGDIAGSVRSLSTAVALEPSLETFPHTVDHVLSGAFRTAYGRLVFVTIVAFIMAGTASVFVAVLVVLSVAVTAAIVWHALWMVRRSASPGVWAAVRRRWHLRPSAWAAMCAGAWLVGCVVTGHTGHIVGFAVIAFLPVLCIVRVSRIVAGAIRARQRTAGF